MVNECQIAPYSAAMLPYNSVMSMNPAPLVLVNRQPVQKTSPRPREHTFTIGIEEEFQIIDPETRELRSHIQQILADGKVLLKERV
jgi:hypothetical protein